MSQQGAPGGDHVRPVGADGPAPAGTAAEAGDVAPVGPVVPSPRPPRSRRRRARALLVGTVLAVVIVAGLSRVLWIIVEDTSPSAVLVALVLALLPVLLVGAAFLWLDRFEAEPPGLLLFALGWGGGVATAIALAVNTQASVLLDDAGPPGLVTLAVVAPLTEEVAKALGVVGVLLLRRRELDGVVDGIVYAGMVGIGFAFVENVLYFSRSLVGGGTDELAVVFVLRAVVSPFAHPLFTMAVGVGIGLALTRRGPARWLFPVAGLLVAVTLHGLWNGSTFVDVAGGLGFPLVYVLLQVPVFVGAVVLAVLARRRESRVVRRHLDTYAAAGWITGPEAAMVASLPERRRPRGWARPAGGPGAEAAMVAFQELACELAFARERHRGRPVDEEARTEEERVLASLWLLRRRFLAPSGGPTVLGRAPVPA